MQWFNAKTNKPSKDGKYLVCIDNYVTDTKVVSICDYAKNLYNVDNCGLIMSNILMINQAFICRKRTNVMILQIM